MKEGTILMLTSEVGKIDNKNQNNCEYLKTVYYAD